MTGETLVIGEMAKYGMNTTNFNANPESCQVLYDAMVKNYPCFHGGICTPVGGSLTFFIIFTGLILLAVYAGKMLRDWELKNAK